MLGNKGDETHTIRRSIFHNWHLLEVISLLQVDQPFLTSLHLLILKMWIPFTHHPSSQKQVTIAGHEVISDSGKKCGLAAEEL